MAKKDENGHLTPNQVVAHNLRRARLQEEWTQEEVIRRLRDQGINWSKASYSAAERSVASERKVRFDADLLVAFSRIFHESVDYFFREPKSFVVRGDLLPREGVKPNG